MKFITELYGMAWFRAINQVADMLNEELGTTYTFNDWSLLQSFAEHHNLKFTWDGYVFRKGFVNTETKQAVANWFQKF